MLKKVALRAGILFLYLLSLLPFWFLWLIADAIYVVLYYLVGYRRQVVRTNLANSFPEKSEAERLKIEKQYYRYLGDLLVETVKTITISAAAVRERMKPTNPELVDHYFSQGRSIIFAAGHYCNWEFAALGFSRITNEKRIVVYKPLSNDVFNVFFNKVRSRFGATVIPMKNTLRTLIALKKELTITVLVSDQTPNRHEINYFTNFLNQPTAVFLGIEKLAKLTNAVVIFYKIDRVKRGYYTYTMVPLIEQPKQAAEYEITEAHVRFLEKIIQDNPQYWLWSHRRWKFAPEDLNR